MMPNNRIHLLQNSEAYFSAIEGTLDRAMHDIYLETDIFENNNTGRRIAEALVRAALRDVETHLLIDGYGSIRLPKSIFDVLAGEIMMGNTPTIQLLFLHLPARLEGLEEMGVRRRERDMTCN